MTRYHFTLAGLLALFTSSHLLPGPAATPRPRIENLNKLPLAFERNEGQTGSQVKFLARGQGYTLFLTPGEAVLALHKASAKSGVLRMKLLGANPAPDVSGVDEMPGKSNYFIGNDAKQWHTNVPMYAKVKYKSVYSGIDLVYYGNQRQLEYDFVVAPGADPRRIQLGVCGARKISRSEDGDLVLAMDAGEIRWHKPVVYQETAGARQEIAANYAIKGKNRVGFQVAGYDPRMPLFIDPLIYSTYLGGSGSDNGSGIAVDGSGNAYVTGYTSSTDFPTMNPLQPTNAAGNGGFNVFVAKVNATGSALVYSTYLGGSGGDDQGLGIAVDSSGNAYVTGTTDSSDFPTLRPLQPAYAGGYDAFVTKLSPTGSTLVYSTYLGGSGYDAGYGVAVDSSDNAYATGSTTSTDFPTMHPLQPANGDGGQYEDTFAAKLSSTGSALVYSTYLGGSAFDLGFGIAVDSSGSAYVTGWTNSTDFPTMNPLQPANGGSDDAFVAKLNPAGSALVYSTYLGGSGADQGAGIAVDGSGNAYVTGTTQSTDFPTMNPLQPSYGGNYDAFVAKLNATGSALVYSTYLGGSGRDDGSGIAVDSLGSAFLIGYTTSANFPTVNPLQPSYGGGGDAFVTKLNASGSALAYSTYLGGSGYDYGSGIAVDRSANAYVAGSTDSSDFPTMNPLQPSYGGGSEDGYFGDAFVTVIASGPALAPANLNFDNQTVGMASAQQVSTLTNTTDATLTITSINVTGPNSSDFSETNSCGTPVPVSGTCIITVTFTPSATGTRIAAVSLTDDAPISPQTLPLTGTGVLPALTFSPTSLTFPNQTINTTSSARKVILKNTGLGILAVGSIAVTGQFSQTNTCGATVNPGAYCTLSLTFTPNATGTLTGSISVSDNAPGSPQMLPLSGVGVSPAATFSPTSLTFPDQTIFTASAAKNVTLTNTGLGILIVGSIAASGPFAQTNTCSAHLNPAASCTISVTFKPKAKGALTGSMSVTDNASGSPQTLALTGTGTYVQISPTSLSFGTQPVGTSSLSKKITLTNKGTATVTIGKVSIAGADAGDFAQTNTCGKSVASGSSCFITVTFTPTATGKRMATIAVSDNGGGTPQTVPLSGSGT
jgi:hypothetical protein